MNKVFDEKPSDEAPAKPSLEDDLCPKLKFGWEIYTDAQKTAVFALADEYFEFLRNARTERERTTWTIAAAEKHGFQKAEIGQNVATLAPGSKIYYVNKLKNVALVVIGQKPMTEKVHLVGSHIDSPRLDLKFHPFVDDSKAGVAVLKTHYYGGIKKYQWATIPLHMIGVIVKTDGTTVNIDIGRDPTDPVFAIPDLLIHLSRSSQGKRTMAEVIKAEEMNILAGGFPIDDKDVKEKFKIGILKLLHEKYGIIETDFLSAEISLVSGIPPRYVGFDKSMIGAAGHDDGVCAWTSLKALFDLPAVPEHTSVVCLFDKEEIGSNGATGAESQWLKFIMNDIMVRGGIPETPTNLHLVLTNSFMLSSDVSAALDPAFKSVHDPQNVSVLGKGVNLMKYSGSGGKYSANDATAEAMGYIRGILENSNVPYQISLLGEVDVGGGGTIAKYIAETFNCDVVDAGTPVLNMHSPFEIIHVADLYATYIAYIAFLGAK